jgi:hypothetical protein
MKKRLFLLPLLFLLPYTAYADETINFNTSANDFVGGMNVGGSRNPNAESFTPSLNEGSVVANLDTFIIGAGTGPLQIEIQTDSGGHPSGTVVGGPVNSGFGGSSSCNALSANPSITATLNSGTTYWLVLFDNTDSTNYSAVCTLDGSLSRQISSNGGTTYSTELGGFYGSVTLKTAVVASSNNDFNWWSLLMQI